MSGVPFSQQKIAEKLTILNDRALGITIRIYNIKKACGDPKSKPSFLSDRSLEASLKYIVKRFPVIDVKSGGASVQAINNIRQDITKSLSLYYFTFVDLLELKDHITEALTTVDACQFQLDLTLSFDLTTLYLTLVVRYITIMILLSRVDDRRAVLGLYNAAYELQHGSSEACFPRLGQLIVEYDSPLKKLSEEFIPHSRVLLGALSSIASVYNRRNLTASQWRSAQMLSLTASSQQLLYAAQTDMIPCEYLSLEEMDRWIIFCHQHLGQPALAAMWQQALQNLLTTVLFRDEVILTHSYIISHFETIKGLNKRISDVKEYLALAMQNSLLLHRERRKFLRSALKELSLLLADQPGLLGPKILFVWMALSFARDEVSWLVRHIENWPQKAQQGKSKGPTDLHDRQLPELFFVMEELRGLVLKYSQVIQRYYIQYLSGYDAIALNDLIQKIGSCPEDESLILSSICKDCAEVTVAGLSNGAFLQAIGIGLKPSDMSCFQLLTLDNGMAYDFRGIRLDWCRLQAYMSCGRSSFLLSDNPKFAYQMNQLVFHTKMVDWLDQMLVETSDLSIYCFYSRQFEYAFTQCVEFPSQARFIAAFPQICTHFINSLHDMCQEERQHISERSLSLCNLFLEEMAKEAKEILTNIADHHCVLADRVLPKFCARKLNEEYVIAQQKKTEKANKISGSRLPPNVGSIPLPGTESERRSRDEMNTLDKLQAALSELCYAINYYPQIVVWEHTFAPREYFIQQIESRFNKCVVGMAMYNPQTQEIAKPSELHTSIRAYMNVLQSVENSVYIDITRVFNNILLQQTQPQDGNGQETITALYTKWYLEVLLRRVSSGQILYSSHQLAFIALNNMDTGIHFNPQEYTDFTELKALADLIGAYGVKFLCERLMWHVASQIQELKTLVVLNKEILRTIRSNYDNSEKMRDLYRQLTASCLNQKMPDASDSLLQRLCIVGEILCFKTLVQNALKCVLAERVPFLMSSISDLKRSLPEEHNESLAVAELCSASGIETSVETSLVSALKAQKQEDVSDDEDYLLSCLLMVFIAVCLPKYGRSSTSFYKASIGAHLNNSHCVAKAVNEIAGALFTIHARGDTVERMKEFLALSSGSILRMIEDPIDEASTGMKESVYLLLDKIVDESQWLSIDSLESCFPYVLLRSAYHYCYKQEQWLHT